MCKAVGGGTSGASVRRWLWSHMLGQAAADTYPRSTTRRRVSRGVSMCCMVMTCTKAAGVGPSLACECTGIPKVLRMDVDIANDRLL